MSYCTRASLSPLAGAEPMTGELSGTATDIPVVVLGRYPSAFEITLGNHPDPAAWLRQSAAALLDLADRVDRLPVQDAT